MYLFNCSFEGQIMSYGGSMALGKCTLYPLYNGNAPPAGAVSGKASKDPWKIEGRKKGWQNIGQCINTGGFRRY